MISGPMMELMGLDTEEEQTGSMIMLASKENWKSFIDQINEKIDNKEDRVMLSDAYIFSSYMTKDALEEKLRPALSKIIAEQVPEEVPLTEEAKRAADEEDFFQGQCWRCKEYKGFTLLPPATECPYVRAIQCHACQVVSKAACVDFLQKYVISHPFLNNDIHSLYEAMAKKEDKDESQDE